LAAITNGRWDVIFLDALKFKVDDDDVMERKLSRLKEYPPPLLLRVLRGKWFKAICLDISKRKSLAGSQVSSREKTDWPSDF